MKLYLLRHGEAAERGDPRYADDALRPLTGAGTREVERLARALRHLEVAFDAIASSPLVRARATAEIVARGQRPRAPVLECAHLAPAGDPKKLVSQLRGLQPVPRSLLLVGHEPDLSGLVALWCTGGTRLLDVAMKKAGLCRLEVETLRAGRCATLEWLVPPRVIAAKPAKR
jgi:phosphohistidine phosphatase